MAGRYMTISSESEHGYQTVIAPIKFSSDKTCRVTNGKAGSGGYINKDRFVSDFNSIESEINTNWDSYNRWKAKNQACLNGTKESESSESHCTGGYEDYACVIGGQNKTCTRCRKSESFTVGNYKGEAKWYGGTETCSWSECGYGHGSRPNYSSQIATALNTWQTSIETRENYINDINNCTTTSSSLNFDPTLKFTYEEPIYGVSWTLSTLKAST